MKIGFFDSGLGGLTILRETVAMLPEYEYVYYGDTENVPYGDLNEESIYEFTKAAVEYLFAQDCALVILACNTASAETLRRLQDTYLTQAYPTRRILGVVIPTIEEMVQSGAQKLLLLATKRTVDSHKYEKELAKRNITQLVLTTVAMPELVPLLEHGKLKQATELAIAYINAARDGVDTVVLGCTHYSLLKEGLRTHFGEHLHILSQDEIIPRKIAQYVMRHPELASLLGRDGTRTIYLTKDSPQYRAVCEHVLGEYREIYNESISESML